MSNQNDLAKTGTQDITMGYDTAGGFALMQRVATSLSKSTLVPKNYQGNISDCMIALNMAQRMSADPLMVMQNLYIVHGKPSFSASFMVATFNASGRFSAIHYDWVGETKRNPDGSLHETFGCYAWATEKETGERLNGTVITMKMAKDEGWYGKNGSKWKTMPQQMLMYRAATFFIRAYAPEIMMGMHATEEVEDTIDITDYADVTAERDQALEQAERKTLDIGEAKADAETGEVLEIPSNKAKKEPKPAQKGQEPPRQQPMF